jgi:hypothetical protein
MIRTLQSTDQAGGKERRVQARRTRWKALSISYNIQTLLGKNRPKRGSRLDFLDISGE